MSELKNDTYNELFKVQQISNYQRAFEELKNRGKAESKNNNVNIREISSNPANDNDALIYNNRDKLENNYCCVML